MSPLSNATSLANYASGIGTQGATLEIQTANKRVGIGTTNPQGPAGSLQVGTAVTISGNSGIVSATTFHGDFGSSTSVAGNLSVSGVLTYEDVTNIDSVGIVTARSGVSVPDGQKILLGTSNDLQIYHDGSNSYIKDAGTGYLIIQSGRFEVVNAAGNESIINAVENGAVELYHDNSKKFETTSGGVSVTGTLNASTRINVNNSTTTTSDIVHSINTGGSLATVQRTKADGTIQLGSVNGGADTANIVLNANGAATFTGEIKVEGSNTPSGLYSGISRFGSLLIGTTSEAVGNARLAIDSGNGNITSVGSATFGSPSASTGGVEISRYGAYIRSDDSYSKALAIYNGGYTASDETILFNSNGSASFAGDISHPTFNTASNDAAAKGITAYNSGQLIIQGSSSVPASSQTSFAVYQGNSERAGIKLDGSATFDGDVQIGENSGNAQSNTGGIFNMSAGRTILYHSSSETNPFIKCSKHNGSTGSDVVTINDNGSATFQSYINAYDVVTVSQTTGTYNCFAAQLNGSTNAAIKANGSATFAGRLSPGTSSSNDHAIVASNNNAANATLVAQNHNNSGPLFKGYNSSVDTVTIKADGSATFASQVSTSDRFDSNRTTGTDNVFNGRLNNSLTSSILANGSANFASTVLIGTTTPSSLSDRLLSIGGGSRSASYQEIRSSSSGVGGVLFSDGTSGDAGYRGQVDYAHSIDELRFYTSATPKVRIQGDGIIRIQPAGATTSSNMVIDRSGDWMRIKSQKDGSGSTELSLQTQYNGALNDSLHIYSYGLSSHYSSSHVNQTITTAPSGTSSFLYRGHYSGGTICFNVWSSGAIENPTGSVGTISDVKLKENIIDAPSQWDDIKAVKFRKFNFKEETGHETHTQLGVVAQEIELISPGLVYESPDQDVEGKDLGTTTKSVKTSILTMKSLVALQEAMKRIETLETQNADLLARVTALEG